MPVQNADRLKIKLKNISQQTQKNVEKALTKSALLVERDAKIKAPVDTGRLRESITHEEVDYGTENPHVNVGTNVEYAPIQEYGSTKFPPHPYLTPAFEENKQKIIDLIVDAVKEGSK